MYPVESWFDRSHNAYLDVLINTGVVGLAAYLSIFALAFWYLWRSWRTRKINYQTLAIFAVIVLAYGIQNITLFDTQVTLLMIFSILAFITFLSVDFLPPQEKSGKPVRLNFISISLTALVMIFLIYFLNIKPALVNMQGIDVLISLQQNNIAQAMDIYKQAYNKGTFGLPEISFQMEESSFRFLGSTQIPDETKKQLIALVIDGMKKSLEMEPLNVRFMLMLSNFYMASLQYEPSLINEADTLLQKALELSPERQEIFFSLGQIRAYQGRISEVLPLFKKAVELNEKVAQSHWNYGLMAIVLDQKSLGEAEIKRAKELGYSYDAAAMKQLISAYMQTKDRQKMMAVYQEWIGLDPTNPDVYLNLAATFYQLDEKENARDFALKAVQLDPTLKDRVDQFIKALGF